MSNGTKSSDSGDRLVSGIDNINEARGKLKNAFCLIISVGHQKFRAWSNNAVDDAVEDAGDVDGSEYFSGSGTCGWLLSTLVVGGYGWQISYVDYNRSGVDAIVATSHHGYQELPADLVMSARQNLGVLVDGLIDRFPGFRRDLEPFFNAADAK